MTVFDVEPPTATGMTVPPLPPSPPTASTAVSLSAVPVPPERAKASDWAPLLDELLAKPSDVTAPEAPVLPEPWLVAGEPGLPGLRRVGSVPGDEPAATPNPPSGLPAEAWPPVLRPLRSLVTGAMPSRPVLSEKGLGVAEPVLPLPPVLPELDTGLATAVEVASPVLPELVAEDWPPAVPLSPETATGLASIEAAPPSPPDASPTATTGPLFKPGRADAEERVGAVGTDGERGGGAAVAALAADRDQVGVVAGRSADARLAGAGRAGAGVGFAVGASRRGTGSGLGRDGGGGHFGGAGGGGLARGRGGPDRRSPEEGQQTG